MVMNTPKAWNKW